MYTHYEVTKDGAIRQFFDFGPDVHGIVMHPESAAALAKKFDATTRLFGHPIHTSPAVPPGRAIIVNKEAPMGPNPYVYPHHSHFADLGAIFAGFGGFPVLRVKQISDQEKGFRELDLQNGDTIRLESATGSVLAGKITQVRQQDDDTQVRIAGFDETPHGNHNTWFALKNYPDVKVVSRGFRWTDEDREAAAFYGIQSEVWEKSAGSTREHYRTCWRKKRGQLTDRGLVIEFKQS